MNGMAQRYGRIMSAVYGKEGIRGKVVKVTRGARHLSLGVRLADPRRLDKALSLAEPIALACRVPAVIAPTTRPITAATAKTIASGVNSQRTSAAGGVRQTALPPTNVAIAAIGSSDMTNTPATAPEIELSSCPQFSARGQPNRAAAAAICPRNQIGNEATSRKMEHNQRKAEAVATSSCQ